MLILSNVALTKFAHKCNELSQPLQRNRYYKLTAVDHKQVLQPFSRIWYCKTSITIDELLESGLTEENAAFLVGLLSPE